MENKLDNESIKRLERRVKELDRILKVVNILEKKYKNSYIHISPYKLNFNDLKNTNKNSKTWLASDVYYNPRGLWLSCGASWLKFLINFTYPEYYADRYFYLHDKSFDWMDLKYIYKIDIDESKVKKINNLKELIEFQKEFGNIKNHYKINWNLVKNKYDGLIICPYLGYDIWKKNVITMSYIKKNQQNYILDAVGDDIEKYPQFFLEWYRHWETGTGVIWKKRSIKKIELLDID